MNSSGRVVTFITYYIHGVFLGVSTDFLRNMTSDYSNNSRIFLHSFTENLALHVVKATAISVGNDTSRLDLPLCLGLPGALLSEPYLVKLNLARGYFTC